MPGDTKNKKAFTAGIIGSLSIKRKIVLIIMLVSSIAMFLAGGAFITYEWFSFRERMVNDLSVQAKMLADNIIGALSFDDPKDAEEVLRSLQAKKPIAFACVYRSDGTIFAAYQREGFSPDTPPPEPQEDGYSFDGDGLVIFKRVILNNRPIGTVYLQSDLSELSKFIRQSVAALTLMLLLSSIVAYALSSRIQKVISMPILSLAETAGEITAKKDYSVRAEKKSEDEVGHLIDSFNDMLTQIQQRDNNLQESENRYRTLFESANDAIFIMKDDLFIDCNRQTLEMFGCGREQIINQPPYRFSPPMQPDGKSSRDKALKKIEAAYNGNSQFFEWKHRKYDGTLFDTEVSFNAIELSSGKYLQAIVRDITGRKQVELELMNEKTFSDAVINSLPGIFYLYEFQADGFHLVKWNKNHETKTGYSTEELFHLSPLEDWFEGDDIKRVAVLIEQIRKSGEASAELDLRMKDGAKIPYFLTGSLLKREGKEYFLGVGIDITQRKQAEKELERHREHLEEVVDERTRELEVKNRDLESFNKLFVDREFRIKELKEKVKELEKRN